MPSDTATIVAELAAYAVALARLQSHILYNIGPEELARNGKGVIEPSVADFARTSELLGRLAGDIAQLAELHILEGDALTEWSFSRIIDFTAMASSRMKTSQMPGGGA